MYTCFSALVLTRRAFLPNENGSTSFSYLFTGTVAKSIIWEARRHSSKNATLSSPLVLPPPRTTGSCLKGISKRQVVSFIVAQTSNCQRLRTPRCELRTTLYSTRFGEFFELQLFCKISLFIFRTVRCDILVTMDA